MNLKEYRVKSVIKLRDFWPGTMTLLKEFILRMPDELDILRGMNMFDWYTMALVNGPELLSEPYSHLAPIFEDQCKRSPDKITVGEITLAGHANLFACSGKKDCTLHFRGRLHQVRTKRDGTFADWHHAKALAGIALKKKSLYRGPSGTSAALEERMPFQPGELPGYNPQALIAHLAGAVENEASIEDVWPAFREHVHKFPGHEQAGEFDGACLFWIARIVHHQIGGQPLGETAAWLHRHFNAWADGASLPPLGA